MNNVLTHFKTPEMAYKYVVGIVEQAGGRVKDEGGYITKELRNVQIVITDPCNPGNWPIPNTGWKLPALDEYVNREIFSDIKPEGFRYTYGERLFCYPHSFEGYNQINTIINTLVKCPTSRRGIAITYSPSLDAYESSVPCLQLIDCLIRDGKLHMTVVFRSWDVKRAAPQNIYGLSKLMEYMAKEVGIPTGELTIFAISAHIYEE